MISLKSNAIQSAQPISTSMFFGKLCSPTNGVICTFLRPSCAFLGRATIHTEQLFPVFYCFVH